VDARVPRSWSRRRAPASAGAPQNVCRWPTIAIRDLTMVAADSALAADPLFHLGPGGHVGRIAVRYWYFRPELKYLTCQACAEGDGRSVVELEEVACHIGSRADSRVRPSSSWCRRARNGSRPAMVDGSAPSRHCLNGTRTHWAGLLEKYAIDFEERQTSIRPCPHGMGRPIQSLWDRGLSDVRGDCRCGDESAANRGR
jgi:hypothetical protein